MRQSVTIDFKPGTFDETPPKTIRHGSSYSRTRSSTHTPRNQTVRSDPSPTTPFERRTLRTPEYQTGQLTSSDKTENTDSGGAWTSKECSTRIGALAIHADVCSSIANAMQIY